jgi:hypothetical protein
LRAQLAKAANKKSLKRLLGEFWCNSLLADFWKIVWQQISPVSNIRKSF